MLSINRLSKHLIVNNITTACAVASFHSTTQTFAGHSKWKNIQHRKGKQDARKNQLYSKVSKEIAVAVRIGGGTHDENFRLRSALHEARKHSVPNSVIDSAIEKATGGHHDNLEEITYEGAGPCGSFYIVQCFTDNKNRTAKEMRYFFSKAGGHLAKTDFMFDHLGCVEIACGIGEDTDLVDKIVSTGLAVDVDVLPGMDEHGEKCDNSLVIAAFSESTDLKKLHDAVEDLGIKMDSSKLVFRPKLKVSVDSYEDEQHIHDLLNDLHADPDVQEVFHNLE